MRNLNTLLTLALLYIHKYKIQNIPISGLCLLYDKMLEYKVIKKQEYNKLLIHLRNKHPPIKTRSNGFFWEKYLFTPRIEWLNDNIKQCQQHIERDAELDQAAIKD